jgi:serralysin
MWARNIRRAALATALALAACGIAGASASPAAADWPSCLGEPATIVGTEGNDTIAGTSRDDVIVGLGGDDVITSGGSSELDLICGGDGNDSVIVTTGGDGFFPFNAAAVSGDAGDDRIQGSRDTFVVADYESSPQPVTVDLGAGTESGWGNDTLVRVTAVEGSPHDDVLSGSDASDGLYGEAGDDTIAGLGGGDYLSGGSGTNSIDGGAGRDWLDDWDAPTGVHVNLAKGTAAGWGEDTLRSIEQVYGSKHADTLVGGAGADRLDGLGGNDRLYGQAGKDHLDGGKGRDRADGGPARDVCHAERTVRCP